MHAPDKERLQAGSRRAVGVRRVGVRRARLVEVQVRVGTLVVRMAMDVAVDVDRAASAQRAHERGSAETQDHQRHAEFQEAREAFRDRDPQAEHHDPDGDQGRRVADPPESTDPRRAPELAVLADNGRDGHDVIDLRRVLEAQHEAEAQHGQQPAGRQRRLVAPKTPPSPGLRCRPALGPGRVPPAKGPRSRCRCRGS